MSVGVGVGRAMQMGVGVQGRTVECGQNVQGQKWPTYVRFGPSGYAQVSQSGHLGGPPPPPPSKAGS